MTAKKKKPRASRTPSLPRKMSTIDLCKSLVCVAALHVEDKIAQMKIYEAVRRLQMLDTAAIKEGLSQQRLPQCEGYEHPKPPNRLAFPLS